MKSMRAEWRKELREISKQTRRIMCEDIRDQGRMQKRIADERRAFEKILKGRVRQMKLLRKRRFILEGRLAS